MGSWATPIRVLMPRDAGKKLQPDETRCDVTKAHQSLFIAWPGAAADGRAFLSDARARGACACLVEAAGADRFDLAGDDVATLAGLKNWPS